MVVKKSRLSGRRIKSYGYAAFGKNGKLRPFRFNRRAVGPKDVLIEIAYCGVCHSDVHEVRAEWRPEKYPIVPGHEIIGKVTEVGSAVKKFKVGDTVGVGPMVDSCRKCEACRNHAEPACYNDPTWTYASKEKHIGGQTFGGYSNNIVVDQDFVLRISPKADLAATAPLLCAGTTTYTPLRYWRVGPKSRIGIIGVGGLGHVAVKIAHSLGAYVVAFTTSREKVADAKRLGADDAVVIGKERSMARYAHGLDFILDTASSKHDINKFLSLLKLNGKLVLVGLPAEPLSVQPFSLVTGRHVFAGSGLDGIKGIQEMLDYCARKGITADIEKIPIQKVNEAFDRVTRGDVKYRFVIDISTLRKPQ